MSKIKDRTGETIVANNGLQMTIIAYRHNNDIDVQFEDNTIIYGKTYYDFKKGTISHPNIKKQKPTQRRSRIGETNIANNGMSMTIIKYRSNKDIDIQWDDMTISKHIEYASFKKGQVSHPVLGKKTTKRQNILQESIHILTGQKIYMLEYIQNNKCHVRFEDNTKTTTTYQRFVTGTVIHPKQEELKHIGEKHIHKTTQLSMEIIAYRHSQDIDVKWIDGMITYNTRLHMFRNGTVKRPTHINNIEIKHFAYIFEDNWYYECSHPDWSENKILSVQEMYDYQHKAA